MGSVPVSDLARSGAVSDLVALGTLEQRLRLQVLGTALVGNIVRATTVGTGRDTRVLKSLLQGLRSLQQGRGRIGLDESSTGSSTSLEGLVGGALDLVETSNDSIELLEAEVGLLGELEVGLGLLEDRGLLQGLVGLLLGRTRWGRLEGQGGEGIVGVREGAGIGVGDLDEFLEVVEGVCGLVSGIVDVSEGRVVLDVDGLGCQSLLQILIAGLFVGMV